MKKKKTWKSKTEITSERAAAAWKWLHKCIEMRRVTPGVRSSAALFIKFLPRCEVVSQGTTFYASMGHKTWGGIAVPLIKRGNQYSFEHCAPDKPTYLHVTDPEDFKVCPTAAERRQDGIVMVQAGEPVSILEYALTNKNELQEEDLERAAALLRFDLTKDLFDQFAQHFGNPDLADVMRKCFKQKRSDMQHCDPLFGSRVR